MNIRKNIGKMTNAEKSAYLSAVLALKADTTSPRPAEANSAGAKNRYDVFVWIHSMVMNGAHKGAAFTPWHREFLRQFELELQAASGNPAITVPYWDCVTARTSSDPGYPFTPDFIGGMGTGSDNRVTSGPFAESAGWVLNVITGQATGNRRDNTSYLRRRTGQNPAQLPELPDLDIALTRTSYDAPQFAERGNRPSSSDIAASHRKILEYVVHNGPHEWIGGNMMPHTAPNDPVFYLHHSNIDRIWAIWQQRLNGGITNYQPATATPLHSLDSVMAMLNSSFYRFPVLNRPMDVLDHKALGYMYDVDLPYITGVPPDLDFGMVSSNSTVQMSIPFTIQSGRNMKFRVNAFAGDPGFQRRAGTPVNTVVNHTNGTPQIHNVLIEFRASSQSGLKNGLVQINLYINDTDRFYSSATGDYLAGSWSVNLMAQVVEVIPTPIVAGPVVSTGMDLDNGNESLHSTLNIMDTDVPNEGMAHKMTAPARLVAKENIMARSAPDTQPIPETVTHAEHDMPGSPSMDMEMEIVSFKVNKHGEFERVLFTHDEKGGGTEHRTVRSTGFITWIRSLKSAFLYMLYHIFRWKSRYRGKL